MNLERELFEVILKNPEDITPRLVYADWCDEHGDPRGEFIRIQCELAAYRGHRRNVSHLQDREAELFEQHRRAWNGEIHRRLAQTPIRHRVHRRRGLIRNWRYRRGFVESAVVEARALLEFPEALFEIGPLRRLRILDCKRVIRKIVLSPNLPRLESVELNLPDFREDVAEQLISENRPPAADQVLIVPIGCRPVSAGDWGIYRGAWEFVVNTLWNRISGRRSAAVRES